MTTTIVIFGATGGTGRCLTQQGLDAGYRVRAFARDPNRVTIKHDRLEIVQGDVFDPDAVDRAVNGTDGVLCALGSLPWFGPPPVCSVGTKHILAAMQRHGVRRLICETAHGVGEAYSELSPWTKIAMALMRLRRYFEDKVIQEDLVARSGVDWVIVQPERLTNGPKKGCYRVGTSLKTSGLPSISRADTAAFMLEQMANPTHLRQKVVISN